MDEKSLEILEFPQIREILAGYTSFSAGRELALSLEPLDGYAAVSLGLQQSAEARHLLAMDTSFSTDGAFDVREAVGLAALGGVLEPVGLVEVQQTLAALRRVRSYLSGVSPEAPLLWEIARDIEDHRAVEKEIERCISPAGEVQDRASPQLAAIRRQLREKRQRLIERLEGIMRTPRGRKIVQEPVITERGGRYVIPVRVEYRKEIRGITHDLSNTGASVYVEPWTTVELGNDLRELVTAEKREVDRVLRNLSKAVGEREDGIRRGIARLAELDLNLAKARYAQDVRGSEPELVGAADGRDGSDFYIKLVEARHPLLGRKAVPLSVEIGRDFSILVITGPNTGGKTVAMKTIGLLALMAQSGIPIPAGPKSCLPVFDGVFADIGDEQSIEQTLSSFSWHMGNIVRILRRATGRSLVLLDELGTSTDPAEGSALARAILQHFLKFRVLTVATTHFGDLKALAHRTPGLQNAAFDFDPLTLAPTYHLTVGVPGGSNALAVATRLGVPADIIDRAKELVAQGTLDLDEALADITSERRKIVENSRILEQEVRAATARNAELIAELDRVKIEGRKAVQAARDEVVAAAAELNRQIRQADAALRKQRSRETVEAARKALASVRQELETGVWEPEAPGPVEEKPIEAGDTVYLSDMDLTGTVKAVSGDRQTAEVQAGQLTIRVGLRGLEKVAGGAVRPPAAPGPARPAARVVSASLDLRGRRADEVEVLLDSYLNDVALSNLGEVQIIHGIGTGTVRQLVRDFLAGHPLVRSFRTGRDDEGRDGVTIVSL